MLKLAIPCFAPFINIFNFSVKFNMLVLIALCLSLTLSPASIKPVQAANNVNPGFTESNLGPDTNTYSRIKSNAAAPNLITGHSGTGNNNYGNTDWANFAAREPAFASGVCDAPVAVVQPKAKPKPKSKPKSKKKPKAKPKSKPKPAPKTDETPKEPSAAEWKQK